MLSVSLKTSGHFVLLHRARGAALDVLFSPRLLMGRGSMPCACRTASSKLVKWSTTDAVHFTVWTIVCQIKIYKELGCSCGMLGTD